MTTKNAILLIVKQNPGIDYNTLLNKFAPSYSNSNSARAALSRSLKDLAIFGLLERKDNRYFLLEKGEGEIYSEIKNKLVIALNSLLSQKHPAEQIDSVIEKLQVLLERGRQDRDLLKTSKSSLDFSISRLENVSAELELKVRHLDYLSKIFGEQIKSLKELDFNDSYAKPLDLQSSALLIFIFSGQPDTELRIECENIALLNAAAAGLDAKVKNSTFAIPKASLGQLLSALEKHGADLQLAPLNIFSSMLKAQLYGNKAVLSGPYSIIENWKQGGATP